MINKSAFVSVCMITYNHEFYISQAIEGVLMQNCNFPYELIISDDSSTDNTYNICKKYANENSNIKLLQSVRNQGMMANFLRALNQCTGKYIAICEGDDYWIDSLKLQKQVDFLNNNNDFGLVYTDYSVYYQENRYLKESFSSYFNEKPPSGNIFQTLLNNNTIATLTVMARSELIMDALAILKDSLYKFKMGDYPLWLQMALNTKIKYLSDITSVYRVSRDSASNHSNLNKRYEFLQSMYDIKFFFCNRYNLIQEREEILKSYNRFICYKAFDLKYKNIDSNIIKSFQPVSFKDRVVILSLRFNIINLLVQPIRKTISDLKLKTIKFKSVFF